MKDMLLAVWLTFGLFLITWGIVGFIKVINEPVDNTDSIQEMKQCTDAWLDTYQGQNGHWYCKPLNYKHN